MQTKEREIPDLINIEESEIFMPIGDSGGFNGTS